MRGVWVFISLLLLIPLVSRGQQTADPEIFDFSCSDWETIGRLTLYPNHTFHIATRTGLIRNETIGQRNRNRLSGSPVIQSRPNHKNGGSGSVSVSGSNGQRDNSGTYLCEWTGIASFKPQLILL